MVEVNDMPDRIPPCLLVAHTDAVYLAALSRVFRRLGWDVYPAHSGTEARRLAHLLTPDLLLLAADFPEETGWLSCDKLHREMPTLPIYLVVDQPADMHTLFAQFVGARGVLVRSAGLAALLNEIGAQGIAVAA